MLSILKENLKIILEKQCSTKNTFFSRVESLNDKFMSSILHILPPIYPIVPCLDPDSEYGSGSTNVLNPDLNPQH